MTVGAQTTNAAIVYHQAHDGSADLLLSSRMSYDGTDYDTYAWEAFRVPDAQAITEIRWRGGYLPELAAHQGTIVNFRVSIYENSPGLHQPLLGSGYPKAPATLVSYDTGDNAGETSAGVFGGLALYDYHFVLPTVFQAEAGVTYWIQIEAWQDYVPNWGLAAATGDGSYFRRFAWQIDYYFRTQSGDGAFAMLTSDAPSRTIAATPMPASGGSIANAGLYPDGAVAPLVATPSPGYAFLHWTEDGSVVRTLPNYTFTVDRDRTLVGHFGEGAAITTLSEPTHGGATDGGGDFVLGADVTLEAVPNANYSFVNWTDGGAEVSTEATYVFAASADRDLVAHFEPTRTDVGMVYVQPHDGSSALLPSAFFTPDGKDGEIYAFDQFTPAATESITDVYWHGGYTGGRAANPVVEFVIKFYPTSANGLFVDYSYVDLDTGKNYLAKYTIESNASETFAGRFGGVDLYDYHFTLPDPFPAIGGTPYWIQIEASQAGFLLSWGMARGVGGNGAYHRLIKGVRYENPSGDLAFALAAAVPARAMMAAAPSAAGSGSVVGGGDYALGAQVTLTALEAPGFAFLNWTEGGTIVSDASRYVTLATADRELVAHFVPTHHLTLGNADPGHGTVSGSGVFMTGAEVAATATPQPGEVFLSWTENDVLVSRSPRYGLRLVADRHLVAHFAPGFEVRAMAVYGLGGTIEGAGGYATGTTAQLAAMSLPGYRFSHWSEGGVEIARTARIELTVTATRDLVAHFEPILSLEVRSLSELFLHWPSSALGWVLKENLELRPDQWLTVPGVGTAVGSEFELIRPIDTTEVRFFRLEHP